jgi:hypothetical protein
LFLVYTTTIFKFFMETFQLKSICECGREFDKPVGLSIHKRTCKTKAAEKERDAQYGRELAEREKEKRGMCPNTNLSWLFFMAVPDAAAAAARMPRRARPWEDPKFRGKRPEKPLVINGKP